MAEPDFDEIVVAGSGLTVRKRLDRERFKHLGVVYEIRSDRTDPLDVRIVDTVPASIPVGFHPRYHGENWALGERTVVFEAELEPNAEVVTLYGLGTGATEDIERFRTDPTVEIRRSGDADFRRLESPVDDTWETTATGGEPPVASSSISELAEEIGTDDFEGDFGTTRSSGRDPQPDAGEQLRPDAEDLVTGLEQSIEALQTIAETYSKAGFDPSDTGEVGRTTRFHLDAIRFHAAQLRQELEATPPDPQTVDPKSPTSEESPESNGSDGVDGPNGDSDGRRAGTEREGDADSVRNRTDTTASRQSTWTKKLGARFKPGQGLPWFWIVSLVGLGTAFLGSGLIGGFTRDLILVLLGVAVGIAGGFGWIYPESKLPLPAFPIAMVLAGVAVLIKPFLLGDPSTIPGIATVVAGILITVVPMIVENRRWQLLGMTGK